MKVRGADYDPRARPPALSSQSTPRPSACSQSQTPPAAGVRKTTARGGSGWRVAVGGRVAGGWGEPRGARWRPRTLIRCCPGRCRAHSKLTWGGCANAPRTTSLCAPTSPFQELHDPGSAPISPTQPRTSQLVPTSRASSTLPWPGQREPPPSPLRRGPQVSQTQLGLFLQEARPGVQAQPRPLLCTPTTVALRVLTLSPSQAEKPGRPVRVRPGFLLRPRPCPAPPHPWGLRLQHKAERTGPSHGLRRPPLCPCCRGFPYLPTFAPTVPLPEMLPIPHPLRPS